MRRDFVGSSTFLALVTVTIGLSYANAAPTTPSKATTIVYTNGLGTILTGVGGIDRSRNEALAKRLENLRAKYADAVFVDGGDAIGPMVLSETQFGLPTYRLFDKNRYAAAALSARDGLHSLSFYKLLPPTARVATPLVGDFTHLRTPSPTMRFYPIRPAWAIAERAGGKFQIFGVATTTSLTAIVEPFMDLKLGGNAADQARHVLDHLLPGHVPIVLSDMTPAENDEFARLLNRNALLFEGGYPWRLVRPPAKQKPTRDVGPVRIVSHFSPGQADVVSLPPSLECKQARLVRTETFWKPEPPPSVGGLNRLLGRQPLEARLVRSWFTETLYKADVGTSLGRRSLIKEIMIPYDDEDVLRIPPPGALDWQPPRWMEQNRHLRQNEIVYRYDLYFSKTFMAHLYRIHHVLIPGITLLNVLVATNEDHQIYRTRVLLPPMITRRFARIDPLLERLRGKRWSEIALEDWPERGGAEFLVDNLVRDLQLLLAIDEAAK
ncbi:hypothetical protein AMJ85_03525 [candidate division BRC1 bacterium SM23_51]|nr:MAG: hypothetical protein AMJ85_03525 [candidate division BRC1 bacterium SM23_51]